MLRVTTAAHVAALPRQCAAARRPRASGDGRAGADHRQQVRAGPQAAALAPGQRAARGRDLDKRVDRLAPAVGDELRVEAREEGIAS